VKGIASYFTLLGGALFIWMVLFSWLGNYIAALLSIDTVNFNFPMLMIVTTEAILSLIVGYMLYKLVISDGKDSISGQKK
jgi:sulfopyruvate decarboxylase TPP-binding subunit